MTEKAAWTISSNPLRAADTMEAQWNQVCRVANGRELLLTNATGEQVRGVCYSVDVDGLGVRAKGGQMTRIARADGSWPRNWLN